MFYDQQPDRAVTSSAVKNVFVLGLDERHRRDVEQIDADEDIRIHPLLAAEDLVNKDNADIPQLLDRARGILDGFEHVDGLVCHWDFPSTSINSILCEEYNLKGPSLTALLKCSHKFWSRLEQRKVVPEHTPAFCAFDPFAENPLASIKLEFPFWIKPIKGFSSQLGFHIRSAEDFDQALVQIREKIRNVGDAFSQVLSRVELPEELKGMNGNWMLAEQYIGGVEFAPEGYIQDGVCHIHGMFNMVIGPNGKSFERYEYPSTVSAAVRERAEAVTCKLLKHVGFDNGCFNVEFFWDEPADRLWIIEINPRISQSHSYMFEQVKGLSNHEVAVKVALGREPHFDDNRGPHNCAAKFLYRRYDPENLRVTQVPGPDNIERLRARQPDTEVYLRVEPGMQLADTKEQDPYSFVLAEVLIAADSRDELERKFQEAQALLPFEFEPVRARA